MTDRKEKRKTLKEWVGGNPRTNNTLDRAGIWSEQSLYEKIDKYGYVSMRGLGKKTFAELQEKCQKKLYYFRMIENNQMVSAVCYIENVDHIWGYKYHN